MEKYTWIILVILAGASLPIQAGLNTKMGKIVESPILASFSSFAIGAVGLLIYMLLTKQTFNLNAIGEVPVYTWTSGLLGAFYVTIVIFSFEKLGAPLTFGLVVAGQMFVSLLLDNNKILVEVQHPINFYRIFGVSLIIAGVVLIRKF